MGQEAESKASVKMLKSMLNAQKATSISKDEKMMRPDSEEEGREKGREGEKWASENFRVLF